MTYSIFFDLETSDLNFLGQILNFSFIVVDSGWNVVDELSSEIKINRLQLPRARAIAANRINVLEHQKRAKYTESQAMARIAEFLQGLGNSFGGSSLQLIGYNSTNFDLPYLRTSLIRNGYNPYFKVQNRDLFLLAQKLWIDNEEFRAKVNEYATLNQVSANLKLETLCKSHDLLAGKQLHESRDDVLLTIELAKAFLHLYGLDIRSFEPYEGRLLHRKPKGSVFKVATGVNNSVPKVSYYTLLEADIKSALWVDLNKYQECLDSGLDLRLAVRWIKFEAKIFIPQEEEITDLHYLELAKQALDNLKDLHLQNFFEETTCDIEQFIYRLPFGSFQKLYKFMHDPKGSGTLSVEEKELVRRFRLANYELGGNDDAQMQKALKEYAEYRYGGKAQLAKSINPQQSENTSQDFHPTLDQQLEEIEQTAKDDLESQDLMKNLQQFYLESEIYQILKQ